MRSLILTLLSVLTLTTTVAAGAARGRTGGAEGVVICTGRGPVMVYPDATGAPAGPPELCPDGIIGLLSLSLVAPPEPPAPLRRAHLLVPPSEAGDVAFPVWIDGNARAPPLAA